MVSPTIRVLLADDQPLLVKALATILNAQDDIRVVATAGTGEGAMDAAATHTIDVAVLDIRMPSTDGITAARHILSSHSDTKVIMLTTFNDESLVRSALAAGVHGFLLRDADPDILTGAVRAVHNGEAVLASGVTGPVLATYRQALRSDALTAAERQGLNLLTAREREILAAIARGRTNPEIAAEMVIAETTVKSHVSSLLRKLHARDRVALVLIAQRAGLLPR